MNDLISKHDALELVKDVCDAIMSCCGSHYDEETKDEVYDDILEVDAILKCNKEIRIALKNMPSAQPERKRGKWILDEDPHDGDCRCSACLVAINEMHERNHGLLNALTGGKWWTFYKFCPNCGADMRGNTYDKK